MVKKETENSDLKKLINEIEVTNSASHLYELKPQILKYLKEGD